MPSPGSGSAATIFRSGLATAQSPGAAHQRAAGAEPGDEDVDLGARGEDLLGRALLVRARIRRVAVLEGHVERRVGFGELAGERHRAVGAELGGRVDDSAPNRRMSCSRSGVEPRRHDDRHIRARAGGTASRARCPYCRWKAPGSSARATARPGLGGGVEHATRATRSLTEPVGLNHSSFANRRALRSGASRVSSTSGVPPTVLQNATARGRPRSRPQPPPAIAGSTITLASGAAACRGRRPRARPRCRRRCSRRLQISPSSPSRRERSAGCWPSEVVEGGAKAVAAGLDGARAARHRAQDRGQAEA